MENARRTEAGAIARRLSEVAGALAEIAANPWTQEGLRYEASLLRLGAVRVCVLGATGSGKSTLINALMGRIVVPESGNTSTPIPVWFTYGEGESPRYRVRRRDAETGQAEELEPDETAFVRDYCFSLSDILEEKRSRFNSVELATAEIDSELLSGGATLIDTLGISASSCDTAKTLKVIDDSVDLVLFVTKNNVLQTDEAAFLRKRVLDVPGSEAAYPVPPERLLVVLNQFSHAASRVHLENSVRDLLQGAERETVESVCRNNLFIVHARNARLKGVGPYDYVKYATEGSSELEIEMLRQYTQDEAYLDRRRDELDGLEMDRLADAVAYAVRRLLVSRNAGAGRHISRLREEIVNIRASANAEIARNQAEEAEMRRQIRAVRGVVETFEAENAAAIEAFDGCLKGMQLAIRLMLREYGPSLKKKVKDGIAGMGRPDGFQMRYGQFMEKSEAERERFVEEWLGRLLYAKVLPDFCRDLRNQIMSLQGEMGDANAARNTPGYWIAEVKMLMLGQETRMRALVDELNAAGAKDIGIELPSEGTIAAWAKSMAAEVEQRILSALLALCDDARAQIEREMQEILRYVRVSLWGRFIQPTNAFWKSLRDNLLVAVTESICDSVLNPDRQEGGLSILIDMQHGVDNAYRHVSDELKVQLGKQAQAVRKYLASLEASLQDDSRAKKIRERTQRILRELAAQERELDAIRSRLETL